MLIPCSSIRRSMRPAFFPGGVPGNISRPLLGLRREETRYIRYLIADPEKALLDWIYLTRQEGPPTPFDELQLQFLDPSKLRQYAQRFPGTVQTALKDLLIEKAFLLVGSTRSTNRVEHNKQRVLAKS